MYKKLNCVITGLACFLYMNDIKTTLPYDGMNQWDLVHIIEKGTVGTVITQADIPYTISVAGNYTLCEDLSFSGSGSPAITITESSVHLNLNNYTIQSTQSPALAITNATSVTVSTGSLSATNTAALTVSNVDDFTIDGVNVTSYPDFAFIIDQSLRGTVQNCFFDISNGITTPSALPPATFSISNSIELIIKNCTVTDPRNSRGFFVANSCNTIHFDNCIVDGNIGVSNINPGFDIAGAIVECNSCAVINLQGGFFIDSTSKVSLLSCNADGCASYGILCSLSDGIILENCNCLNCSTNIHFANTTHVNCYKCEASVGSVGVLVENSSNIMMQGVNALNHTTYGFQVIASSYIGFESCSSAENASAGFYIPNVPSSSIVFCKNCLGSDCLNGFSAIAGTLGNIVIKDSLFSGNTSSGIVGTNLYILDTRSGTPFNGIPDALITSTVITY